MEQEIRQLMQVLPEIDADFEIERRVNFIKGKLKESGCKALVLGISGGVDSTTCGRLAQLAVEQLSEETGDKYQSSLFAYHMVYKRMKMKLNWPFLLSNQPTLFQ